MHQTENSPVNADNDMNLVPDGFVPGPTHDELMGDKIAQMREETEAAVAQAIADNPDKERFDFDKFNQLYWKKDIDSDLDGENDAVIRAYEEGYYLRFPGVTTLEDYAKSLEDLDARAGN